MAKSTSISFSFMVSFVMGLRLAALPELSRYPQKIMLGETLCFDNKNPNGFLYSNLHFGPCPLFP
jgi:hypothetical protein